MEIWRIEIFDTGAKSKGFLWGETKEEVISSAKKIFRRKDIIFSNPDCFSIPMNKKIVKFLNVWCNYPDNG